MHIQQPQTFVFIGRSGSGKGTQAELLMKYVKEHDPERSMLYLETGARFRDFLKGDSFSAELSRDIAKEGVLQPEFLAVHMWSHDLLEHLRDDQHLCIDGTPRKQAEARVLHSAFEFYGRERPHIIHVNVSNDWSRTRLLERGREDDRAQESVEKRLAWFESDVMPALEWYKEHAYYNFVEVNGEQSIEEVHQDITKSIFNV